MSGIKESALRSTAQDEEELAADSAYQDKNGYETEP